MPLKLKNKPITKDKQAKKQTEYVNDEAIHICHIFKNSLQSSSLHNRASQIFGYIMPLSPWINIKTNNEHEDK